MKMLLRFVRVYTPFICTSMALVNGVLFIRGVESIPLIYLLSTIAGNSILVTLYMMATSLRMCIWYKLNLLCLLIIQISGLLYTYFTIDDSLYMWVVTLLSAMGVLCFLIFRLFYTVTRSFGCTRKH